MMTASLPFVSKSTNDYQKSRREHGPGKKSKKDATLELQNHIAVSISTYWSSIKQQSAWTNTTRAGQEFHTPDPPQGQSAHFLQTVQLTRSTHSIHRTEPGRMAQTRSGTSILLQLQLTHFLCAKEARPRTPDCTGLLATQSALTHRQVLHEGD